MLKGVIATLILDSVADDVEVFIARDARAAGLIYRTYGRNPLGELQCESKNPPLRLSEFFFIFHKPLRIFNRFFTHILYVLMYARLQIFVQLSPTLTKLCHIMRD